MRCYYDILGVDKNVPAEDIKKAYYKMSLKWHPDKNPENSAEATEMFKEIQMAYKVLSNPQERTWYDKNRERFMTMSFDTEEEIYNIINNANYQGFDDDANGFYAVYEHLFKILMDYELEASRFRGEKMDDVPTFGNSSSDYKEVVGPFYSFWESFCTKMMFHWKNKHEINLSFPRDIRRAMEKENSEERSAARKEYNRTIQSLVSSIKSRDPRIKSWKLHLNNKAKDNEKKAARMAQRAWERSQQKMNFGSSVPIYGDISVEELEEKLNNLELDHGKGALQSGSEEEDLYCIACNKYFKSIAAFGNHEKSKNHKKNMADLRKHMIKENEELFSDLISENPVEEAVNEVNEPGSSSLKKDPNEELTYEDKEEKKKDNEENIVKEDAISQDVNESIDDCPATLKSDSKPEKKRRRKPKSEREPNKVPNEPLDDEDSDPLKCDQCGLKFSSRNKLSQHVKSTNHATVKTKPKSNGKMKPK